MARLASEVRAGVVGARGIGSVHLRELAYAGAGSLAICGSLPGPSNTLAKKLSLEFGQSIAALPLDEIGDTSDFVSVCTPNSLHIEHAMTLLERECYVLVEKPLFWFERLSASDVGQLCKRIFDQADGRLAVNYPTAQFAEPFISVCGAPEKLETFDFSYQTRGSYRGEGIAVDLLPHAFSLLAAFQPGVDIRVNRISSKKNVWLADIEVSGTQCKFKFVQNSKAKTSELSFAVNGQPARRKQMQNGNGYAVWLELPGPRPVSIPCENPMSASILAAFDVCLTENKYMEERERSCNIMRLIASTLLS